MSISNQDDHPQTYAHSPICGKSSAEIALPGALTLTDEAKTGLSSSSAIGFSRVMEESLTSPDSFIMLIISALGDKDFVN